MQQQLEVKKTNNNIKEDWINLEAIQTNAKDMVPRALFVIGHIKNYKKSVQDGLNQLFVIV